MIPSRKRCMEVLDEVGMPEKIRAHSLQVNGVAMFLARKIMDRGIPVDPGLVDSASLLHDIDKHILLSKGTQKGHGELGAEMLIEMGFQELAPAVRRHVLCNILHDAPGSWEEKIVHYADMRVVKDRVVPLEQRLEYIRNRYGRDPASLENINRCAEPLLVIEKEILAAAGIWGSDVQAAQINSV
jgi:uncharacterized protein